MAVALVLIFKATTLINFAQGELAMFGTFIAYVLAVPSEDSLLGYSLGWANPSIGLASSPWSMPSGSEFTT
ncbi:MAG: hypothetical protein GY773_23460 [Actinomycetia bacterium]|nr:hypothetical protein [Actinomycetes bacterium]